MSEDERRPLIGSNAGGQADYTQLSDSEAASDEQNGAQDRPRSFAKIVRRMCGFSYILLTVGRSFLWLQGFS